MISARTNEDKHRIEARDDEGNVAGYVTYRLEEGVVRYVHTEVDDAYQGQGVGKVIAHAAMDYAREQGLRIRPDCPFIRGFMRKNEDTHDLLAEGATLDP